MQILAMPFEWFAKKCGIFASIANNQLRANHKLHSAHKSKQILLVSKLLIIYCSLYATEKSYQQLRLLYFIRVSKHLETIKAVSLQSHAFISFSAFQDTLMKHSSLLLIYYIKYTLINFIKIAEMLKQAFQHTNAIKFIFEIKIRGS